MKKTLKINTVLAVLVSSISFQACTPQQVATPTVSTASPSGAMPSATETAKPVESSMPSTTPSVVASATSTPMATPVMSVMPSVAPSVATTQAKTYLFPLSLSTGRGTAYLTLNSDTSGKILVNFQDINDAPTKINLIDKSGNK